MAKAYSTKRPKQIPEEFADFFVRHGWQRCNLTFGKRETLRYVTDLGLKAHRRQGRAAGRMAA